MIAGVVTARLEAVVRLRVRGPAGAETDLEVVVDTGFTASLTLSDAVIAALSLVRQSTSRATLADGTVRQFGLYAAEVEWGGVWRPVLVSAVGGEALAGMALLAGHELRVAVAAGGSVSIAPLP